jgi:hypothetical protein
MRKHLAPLLTLLLPAALLAETPALPQDLLALVASARIGGSVSDWCRVELGPAHPRAFVVAVRSPVGGGHYFVLGLNADRIELAAFAGQAELSCLTAPQAKALDTTIKQSETVHGAIEPVWNTTVVCAFLEPTRAVCWQFSPHRRAFVKVGEWLT